jgi:multimeric flavodoxin WrbA
MKVLLINGSPRKEGNTHTALGEIARQLAAQGVESQEVWVGNKSVHGCIACGGCRAKGENRCVFDDDTCNGIIAAAEGCDAVIVGSPVYYGQPTGQVLCIMQRMLFAGGAAFRGKPAAAVCVCRRGGSTASMQALQMPFQMCNMPLVTSQYWNIAFGREPGQTAQDVEGMQTMRTLANNMAWMLKKMHNIPTTDAPELEPEWTPMNFIR